MALASPRCRPERVADQPDAGSTIHGGPPETGRIDYPARGTLEPGKYADLVILSDDIFAIDPARIQDVRVEATLLGGKLVYEQDAAADAPTPTTR